MTEPTIKIEYEMDDIAQKTVDEKLTLLLRIAFSNHETLKNHGKVLFGNGTAGLCDGVRNHEISVKCLWGLFVSAVTGFTGWIIFHLSSK